MTDSNGIDNRLTVTHNAETIQNDGTVTGTGTTQIIASLSEVGQYTVTYTMTDSLNSGIIDQTTITLNVIDPFCAADFSQADLRVLEIDITLSDSE